MTAIGDIWRGLMLNVTAPFREPPLNLAPIGFTLLVVLFIMMACNPTAISPPNPIPKEYIKLVVDKELIRYSFEYPNYYESTPIRLDRSANTSLRLHLYYPEEAAPRISYLTIYTLYPGGWGVFELDPKLAADRELATRYPYTGFQLVGRSSRMVAGVKAEEIAYYDRQFPYEHRTYWRLYLNRDAYFSRGDHYYSVAWMAPAEAASSFWDDFDHVLNTFKFLD